MTQIFQQMRAELRGRTLSPRSGGLLQCLQDQIESYPDLPGVQSSKQLAHRRTQCGGQSSTRTSVSVGAFAPWRRRRLNTPGLDKSTEALPVAVVTTDYTTYAILSQGGYTLFSKCRSRAQPSCSGGHRHASDCLALISENRNKPAPYFSFRAKAEIAKPDRAQMCDQVHRYNKKAPPS